MQSLLPSNVYSPRPDPSFVKRKSEGLRATIFSDSGVDRNGVGSYYSDLIEHLSGKVDMAELICAGNGENKGFASRWRLPLPGDYTQRIWMPNARRVETNLRIRAPNVVVSVTPGPFGLLGLYYAHRMQVPFVCGFHTCLETLSCMYWTSVARKVNQRFLEYVNQRFFENAVAVVTNSRDMMQIASDMGGKNVQLVGTPVNPLLLQHSPVLPEKKIKRILYVGRLAPEKNIGAILQAAKDIPEMEFLLAGDGPLRKSVRYASKETENLNFLGWVPRYRLKSTIEQADLVVLPSQLESFGTVALETLACRRNVLVSRNCGITSWPSLAKALFVMRTGENLTEALLRVSKTNYSVRRQKAEEGYSAVALWNNATIDKWLSIFSMASAKLPRNRQMAETQ
ncbi:MAG: glycosyltransferase [Verrucomicrobiota bacterium]